MNQLTYEIRQAMARKDFSWMDGTYRFILFDERYVYDKAHKYLLDIPHAYIVGYTEDFAPLDDVGGALKSAGVSAFSVLSDYKVSAFGLVESSGDEAVDRLIAVIDEGYDLPFIAAGQNVTLIPDTVHDLAWVVI